LKDALFQIFQALGPKGLSWMVAGARAANLDQDFHLPDVPADVPGKSKAGGGQ
jgi:hypothetical protein